jgi:zinc/manganese transport system substrate-binding protein
MPSRAADPAVHEPQGRAVTEPAVAPPGPAPAAGRNARAGRHRRTIPAWAIVVAALVLLAGVLLAIHRYDPAPIDQPATGGTIRVVAAEDFWGSLVAQMGGLHVSVLSIVSDPNADPHEYESNVSDAVAIANAQLVIENGAGYDTWFSHLVAASNTHGQVILDIGNVLGLADGSNPHFWYGQSYVNESLAAMYGALVSLDAKNRSYFDQQYALLNASLAPLWGLESQIREKFAGTPVASTETIFQYLANSTGLDLVSPYAFMQAVSEGNDPPAWSVTEFQDQLASGSVHLLVYNEQTVTPLTNTTRAIAAADHIPIVGVTETVQPPGESFELWMGSELSDIYHALNATAPGS